MIELGVTGLQGYGVSDITDDGGYRVTDYRVKGEGFLGVQGL